MVQKVQVDLLEMGRASIAPLWLSSGILGPFPVVTPVLLGDCKRDVRRPGPGGTLNQANRQSLLQHVLSLGFLFQSLPELRASPGHPVPGPPWVEAGTLPLIQLCASASARMFGWIEKVVPQPPVKFHLPVMEEKDTPAEQRAAEDEPGLAGQLPEGDFCNPAQGNSATNQSFCGQVPKLCQGGQDATIQNGAAVWPVLLDQYWQSDPWTPWRLLVSKGSVFLLWLPLTSFLPPPPSASQGLLSWLSQGLQRVIPQPPLDSSLVSLRVAAKAAEASIDMPEGTEVQSINDEEEELEVAILEPEDQTEAQSSTSSNAPDNTNGRKVFTWLMEGFDKIMPQPENRKKAEEVTPERPAEESANSKENTRGTSQSDPFPASSPRSTGVKGGASPDQQSYLSLPLFPQRPGGDGAHSLFMRFLQGLEKVMPQPVTKARPDGQPMKSTVQGSEEERSKGA
ncbi:cyclic nucleotide-gated cation channel beta-1-like [Candoia aspera]|uniref:cyclic nucleotide-gated cation channel beta-1-like n=1 Tax=Candoia aspera TaxID=51853 RepID=UPI002FD80944